MAKNPPPPAVKDRIIALGNEGHGNEEIARMIGTVNAHQVSGILYRAKVKRKEKERPVSVTPVEQEVETDALPKAGQCKWPSGGSHKGDPIRFLCMNTRLAACSYCATHMRISQNIYRRVR